MGQLNSILVIVMGTSTLLFVVCVVVNRDARFSLTVNKLVNVYVDLLVLTRIAGTS